MALQRRTSPAITIRSARPSRDADRIIRSLCRAKQTELEGRLRELRNRWSNDKVKLSTQPEHVRLAFQHYLIYQKQLAKVTKVIEAADLRAEAPQHGYVRRSYHTVATARGQEEQGLRDKLRRLEEIRSLALVTSYGKDPAVVASVLQRLYEDLQQL